MKTYRSAGETVTCIAPGGGVTKDVPVQIGMLVVIPTSTVAEALEFEGITKGQFSGLTKVGTQAWTAGVPIYWDAALGKLSSHSGDNHWVGVAIEAVAGGSGDVLSGKILFDGMLAQADETT